MPGFTGYDDVIAETTQFGKVYEYQFMKIAPAAAEAAGQHQTLWKATGRPGAGADPATTPGTAYDDAVGSMFFTDQSSDFKFAILFEARATQNCTLLLYDRLVGVSGIALSSTGNKTVSSVALPRYAGNGPSADVEAWLEVTTATTTTAPILSMNSYTSGDGSSGLAGGSLTFPAAATDAHTALQLPEVAGEKGVQAISTINVATAASAGVATVVLQKKLCSLGLIANIENKVSLMYDFPPMQRVFDGASLGLMILASVTTAVTVWGRITVVYG